MNNRILNAQLNHAKVIKFIPRNQLGEMFDKAVDKFLSDDDREKFGTLVQGFFGVKHGNDCLLQPFYWMNDKQKEKVRSGFMNVKATEVGISFCKGYRHYTQQ